MTTTALSLMAATVLTATLDESPAVELRYSGTLSSLNRTSEETVLKRFEVYALAINKESGGRELAFMVTETGEDGWAWPERYGLIPLDSENEPTDPVRIRVLHRHEGVAYPVTLPTPVFADADRLGRDAGWTAGSESYEVVQRTKVDDRPCWEVDVSKRTGRVGTLWIDEESPLVISARRRVVMGRGDRFLLRIELDSVNPVDAERLEQLEKPLKSLLDLQSRLGRSQTEHRPELTADQLQAASEVLESLQSAAESTPFNALVSAIGRDVQSQQKRTRNVADLKERMTGRPAPEFQLETLGGETVNAADFSGRVVLLHFWPYRDEPLVEPYGQVGYLDFLHQQRGKLGVEVYGVAVDSRFADESRTAQVRQGIRKLRRFMNLSYPVATDDETLLKKFGDPRRFDAELPLWVVIGPGGKIVHYKVGFYDIDPDKGLQKLDEVVVDQLRKRGSNGE